MRGILDTTAFQGLMRRAWLAPLRKADIDASELPEGCGIEDAWKALTIVRYAQSFHSPRALRSSIKSRDGWHTVPVSLQRTLDEISALTREGSDLDLRAHERKGRGFITQQYVEEMVCNLSFDGFEVGYEDLRVVILGDRPPLDAAEMLALNFHRIMYGLDGFENAPFDEATLEGLYEKLTEGTQGPLAAADALPRSPLFEHYAMECGRDGCGRPTLRIVVDAATGCASDPPRYPLMNSMLVNCQFWRAALFPSCNNLMGCVTSRLYLLQQGHSVFRYVPKIRILEKWRAGGYGDAAAFTFEEALATAEENGDWTPYYDVVMRLMLKEVRSIARSLSVKARVDEDAVAHVRASGERRRRGLAFPECVLEIGELGIVVFMQEAVVHLVLDALRIDELGFAQRFQMLRDGARCHVESFCQLLRRLLLAIQLEEDLELGDAADGFDEFLHFGKRRFPIAYRHVDAFIDGEHVVEAVHHQMGTDIR